MISGVPPTFPVVCNPDISWPAGDITGNVALGLVPLGMVRGPTFLTVCAFDDGAAQWPYIMLAEPALQGYRCEMARAQRDDCLAVQAPPERRPW